MTAESSRTEKLCVSSHSHQGAVRFTYSGPDCLVWSREALGWMSLFKVEFHGALQGPGGARGLLGEREVEGSFENWTR